MSKIAPPREVIRLTSELPFARSKRREARILAVRERSLLSPSKE
jgi:hypothetical protein